MWGKEAQLRPYKTMWFKLGENKFTHSISALNIAEKWSKNHGDLIHPSKVIAPPSSEKSADISIFYEL